ncbi:MAG: hypothetical protein ACOCTG_04845, partial [Bacteroidota bacterium]
MWMEDGLKQVAAPGSIAIRNFRGEDDRLSVAVAFSSHNETRTQVGPSANDSISFGCAYISAKDEVDSVSWPKAACACDRDMRSIDLEGVSRGGKSNPKTRLFQYEA